MVAEVREEHKRAIEWFNEHMNDEISFFLVRTEVYKIGNSEPAVKFNVVVEPNTWSKILRMKGTTDKRVTETRINHLNFWEGFKDFAAKSNTKLRVTRTPRSQHWYDISIGKSGVNLSLTRNTRDQNVGAEIWIGNSQKIFDKLHENKEPFESLIGSEVLWNELENKKASRVRCVYPCDPDDSNRHDEYYQWLIDTSEKLEKAFKKIIK